MAKPKKQAKVKKESVRERTIHLWRLWRSATSAAGRQQHAAEIKRINEGLIRMFVYKHQRIARVQISDEDAYQAVCMALLDSLATYNPSKGAFSTHFGWRVRHELQTTGERSMPIKIQGFGPPYRVMRKIEAFYAKHGRDPEAHELIDAEHPEGEDPKQFAMWMIQSEVHFSGERTLEHCRKGRDGSVVTLAGRSRRTALIGEKNRLKQVKSQQIPDSDECDSPESQLIDAVRKQTVDEVVSKLPPKDQADALSDSPSAEVLGKIRMIYLMTAAKKELRE